MSSYFLIDSAPKDGSSVKLIWLSYVIGEGYKVEHSVVSRWLDGHWDGWHTPTHWEPVQCDHNFEPMDDDGWTNPVCTECGEKFRHTPTQKGDT